jgi:hypothetical protein
MASARPVNSVFRKYSIEARSYPISSKLAPRHESLRPETVAASSMKLLNLLHPKVGDLPFGTINTNHSIPPAAPRSSLEEQLHRTSDQGKWRELPPFGHK